MLKYTLLAAFLACVASPAAQANPASKKDAEEAAKREQLIKSLDAPPRSALNICKGC